MLQSVERYQSENQALRDKASESSDEIERLVEELSQARNELKAATSVSELRQELENVKRCKGSQRKVRANCIEIQGETYNATRKVQGVEKVEEK